MSQILCGNCHATHADVATVRACHTGDLFPCHWLIDAPGRWVIVDDETGEMDFVEGGIRECGADAIGTERGWTCAAGHEHVTLASRQSEGWDYAEEYDEARAMATVGVEPRTMSGNLVTSPRDFAPAWAR